MFPTVQKIQGTDLDHLTEELKKVGKTAKRLKYKNCSVWKKKGHKLIQSCLYLTGLQEWILVATADDTECTLSNILSGILYRFRVTAITKDGLSSFPSDPSEPFVIDIPGVQVSTQKFQKRTLKKREKKKFTLFFKCN